VFDRTGFKTADNNRLDFLIRTRDEV